MCACECVCEYPCAQTKTRACVQSLHQSTCSCNAHITAIRFKMKERGFPLRDIESCFIDGQILKLLFCVYIALYEIRANNWLRYVWFQIVKAEAYYVSIRLPCRMAFLMAWSKPELTFFLKILKESKAKGYGRLRKWLWKSVLRIAAVKRNPVQIFYWTTWR